MKNQPVLIKTHHAEKKHNRERAEENRRDKKRETSILIKHTNREKLFLTRNGLIKLLEGERLFKVFPHSERKREREESSFVKNNKKIRIL